MGEAMNVYRKLLAAVLGLTVLVLFKRYEIDLMGIDSFVVEIIVSLLTALGVYAFPNDEPAQPSGPSE